MKATTVHYRLSPALESILIDVAEQSKVEIAPFTTNFSSAIDEVSAKCTLVLAEFPPNPIPLEVIRARQWCFASPLHTLIAVFPSSEQLDFNEELCEFIDDYVFADSRRQQIIRRFQFALDSEKKKRSRLEQIRQSLAMEQLLKTDYASILGGLAEGVIYQGNNDEVLYANAAACDLLGLSIDQLKGKTSYDPRWQATNELGKAFKPGEHPSAMTLRTGEPMREVFMSIRHAKGETRQVTINTQPIFGNSSDKPSGVIVSFRDCTGVLAAEQERDDMRKQLIQSQKMEALGTLAGGIAHDFNNLLTPILALSQKLKAQSETTSFNRELSVIESNALSARNLVNQILAFSRKKPAIVSRVNLSKLLSSVCALIQEFADSDIAIASNIEPAISIDGDENQLNQLFMNLMTNALKAVKSSEQKFIRVELWKDSNAQNLPIKVAIEDSGIGISPELISRIYEPFYTTRELGEGTGLGLSVAHNVVEAHGGDISCTSHGGKGTCFIVSFDSGYLTSISPEVEPGEEDTGSLTGKALVLDDNKDSCDVLCELIDFIGMEAYKYYSPKVALEDLAEIATEFDLIVSDYSMPGMNGFEFASAARKLYPEIPIAIITGFGEEFKSGTTDNCDMVLSKPIQLTELKSALRKLKELKR